MAKINKSLLEVAPKKRKSKAMAAKVEKKAHVSAKAKAAYKGIFKIRTANQCVNDAKKEDPPKKLFGSLIYEKGLTIFFGNTHAGKTAVAMNVAQSIASGNQFKDIPMEAKAQRVAYFDFELSDKNFELKSSNEYKDHFEYSNNFYRLTLNLAELGDNSLTPDGIIKQIKIAVDYAEAKIFFIDNISWLEQHGLETTKEANKLMKELWKMSREGYAVIVLGHTTKKDDTEPMTISSLAGSAAVSRYLESCLAINWSVLDPKYRYIKQLKNRWGEEEYGRNNVLPIILGKDGLLTFHRNQKDIIQVQKKVKGETQYIDLDLTDESNHLSKNVTATEREEFIKTNVIQGNMRVTDAAKTLGVSRQTIYRDVDSLSDTMEEGTVSTWPKQP